MITAKDALSNLDVVTKDATKYIKEVIEPKIQLAMKTDTFVRVEAVDLWYYGLVYDVQDDVQLKSLAFKTYPSLPVTNKINDILKENGYTVNKIIKRYGNEYNNGYGYFEISWANANKE